MKNELSVIGIEFIPNQDTIKGLKTLSTMKELINTNSVNAISAIISDIVIQYPSYKVYLNDAKLFKKEIYLKMVEAYKSSDLGKYGNSLLNTAKKVLLINNLKLDYSLINLSNLKLVGKKAKNLNKAGINALFNAGLSRIEYNQQLKAILEPLALELKSAGLIEIEALIKEKFNDKKSLNELEIFIQQLKNGN